MLPPEEWLKQADYEMKNAEYLLAGGMYPAAMMYLHLALEKAFEQTKDTLEWIKRVF